MNPGSCSAFLMMAMVAVSQAEPANQLLLYLVEEHPSSGARLVDTKEFPRLGYIAKDPAMRITKLKKISFTSTPVNAKSAQPVTVHDLTIELAETDAKEFGKLTLKGATNSNRIAFFLGDRLLTAVKVADPIYEGKVSMSGSKEESLREIEKELKVLVQE